MDMQSNNTDVRGKLINTLKKEQQDNVEQVARYKALTSNLNEEIQQRAKIIELLEKAP